MNPYRFIKCQHCGAVAQKVDADTYQCVNCKRKTPSYYPSDWQDRRLRVFKRDGFRCVYCGKYGGELHCDHIIPPSEGGSHAEWNLRTVCRKDHLRKHPEKALKYQHFYKKSALINFHPRRDRTAKPPQNDWYLIRRLIQVLVILAILYFFELYIGGWLPW